LAGSRSPSALAPRPRVGSVPTESDTEAA
jgi:hypothetical protein